METIPRVKYIKRRLYVDAVKPYINKNVIKVFVGQRRVGKSYLMYQIIDEIRTMQPDAHIIYISKELHEFAEIRDYNDLYTFVKNRSEKHEKTYLFIDEIQDIISFEKALRSLQAEGTFDIYCTGSNANMLSAELATLLSGRYIEIKILGLSYIEFLEFHQLENVSESLQKYLKYGGLPYLINLKLNDHVVYDYLKSIYLTILYKDILKKYNIRNTDFLERLVEFLADNTGSLISAKKISDYLKNQKINISHVNVLNYLTYLVSAFFIFQVKRSEIGGKKIFEVGEKYYFEDLGLRHSIIGFRQNDIGKIMENVVFLHLIISGWEVTVGKSNGNEVDFVCKKAGEKLYVQVAYLLVDEATRNREFGNLLAIKDNYPKMVVSMDEFSGNSFEGIQIRNLKDFLSTYIQ